MSKLKDNQATQILNIMDTLIEATEHFAQLVKEKELYQSIQIFSSIVDGFDAINKVLTHSQVNDNQLQREKIEQAILMVARELEKGHFIKISEILQFTLMPQLWKLKREFAEVYGKDNQSERPITIGIYHSQANPRQVYPDERIRALVQEGERQGAKLLFFCADDVDFNTEQVTADTYTNHKWQRVTHAFPDVINNLGVGIRSRVDRKLRRMIPFTSFFVGNKFYLPKKLVTYRKFANLLVFFKVCTDETIVHDFLKENNKAVLKPILGRQGERIYFVQKKGNHYSVWEHDKEHIMGRSKFNAWLHQVVLKKKGSYIIQRYIHSRTRDDRPYDIRAHVQKNGEGKWVLTKIYPRIGNKNSILSNISKGGKTEDLEAFLEREFGEIGKAYHKKIRQLAIDLTWHLDKLHGFVLDELGLDLAIDENGRFRLHEVNNGPQSTYHETERAANTIAYAIYLAKNGIVHNDLQKQPMIKGQFNARTSNLPWAELDNRYRIGMLVDEKEVDQLAVACAYVAHYENVHFYYFTPKDIDFNEMLIRGYFYENNEWVAKIVDYPDAIYDRLRLRGIKGYNVIYEELEGIPFTNEFCGNSISKLEVYDKLQATGKLDDVLIPYQKVDRVRDIFRSIQEYEKIILKPEVGSFVRGVHFISKVNRNEYFVAEGENKHHYDEMMLNKYLKDLLKKGTFIVQKYIETRTIDGQPFDIRVHMMKDGNGEWSFVNNYPRIGIHHASISITREEGYIGKIYGFLKRNFAEKIARELESHIEELALKVTHTFESLYEKRISELALDLAIDRKDAKLYLIEINVNKPGIVYYEFDVARHAIPYAIYLAESYN